jgi:hypothetical protein
MATKRFRNKAWAYTVRRKSVLPKPIHLTFKDEEEGDLYVAHLEKLLDKGIVPPEFLESASKVATVREQVREYTAAVAVARDDDRLLDIVIERDGQTLLTIVDYAWCENWVAHMKRVRNLSPGTIRHYVGNWSLGMGGQGFREMCRVRDGRWRVVTYIIGCWTRELPYGVRLLGSCAKSLA